MFVTHNYPRWPGDRAGVFVARIADLARAAGHEIAVVAPHAAGAEPREMTGDIDVRRFRYAPEQFERIGYQGDVAKSLAAPAAILAMPFYALGFRRAVAIAVGEFRPDVIHAHWWIPGACAAVGQGVPLVVTCHGSDVRLLLGSRILRRAARQVLPHAVSISAVSRVMRDDLAVVVPAVASRLSVTYLPVDGERFTRQPAARRGPPRILYAGNLIAAKGVDLILRAYARLLGLGVECELRLVGDGPGRPVFERLAAELGLGHAVVWAGPRPYDEMPGEFAAATVTVLASRGPRGEGLPMTAVEALLGGSAVVATPAGGTGEVIQDGITGLLAADGDAADLARQLGRMLGDPALRQSTVVAGRSLVQSLFAPGPAAARFFALYEAARAGTAR
ncbi:MAG: glycosyltransferase family 4 protein [Gemmatimonadales bacterium]